MIEITEHRTRNRTLVDLLRGRAEERPGDRLYTFLADGEEEGALSYGELDRRARALAAWLQEAGCQGERALLLFPPGLDFVGAFFGCLYAGTAAVPAYPPRLHRRDDRFEEIFRDAQPRVVLTTSALLSRLGERPGALWAAVDQIPDAGPLTPIPSPIPSPPAGRGAPPLLPISSLFPSSPSPGWREGRGEGARG